MKNIHILWLYDDLLDLYGDHGNITTLTYHLQAMQIPYEIHRASIFDTPDWDNCDMVYVGPGKDKNVIRAAQHLAQYSEEIRRCVERGVVFLVTGNAQMLFGKEIADEDGSVTAAAGLFDYTGRVTGKVFINDLVVEPVFSPETALYAFVNRTSELCGQEDSPLFRVRYAKHGAGETEGVLRGNYFGTWALGPVLAKNPPLLREILHRVTGEDGGKCDMELMEKALALTLQEFSAANG